MFVMKALDIVTLKDPYETFGEDEINKTEDDTEEPQKPQKTCHSEDEDETWGTWWDNSSWDKTWHTKNEDGSEVPYHRWQKRDDGYRWHEQWHEQKGQKNDDWWHKKKEWSADDEKPSRWKRKRYSDSWHHGGHEKELKRQMEKKEKKFRKDLAAMTGTTLEPQQPSYPPPSMAGKPLKPQQPSHPAPHPAKIQPTSTTNITSCTTIATRNKTLDDDDGGDIRAAVSQKLNDILIGGGSSSSASSSRGSSLIQTAAVALLTSSMEREKLKTELEQTQQELKKYKSKEQIAALVSQLHALQD